MRVRENFSSAWRAIAGRFDVLLELAGAIRKDRASTGEAVSAFAFAPAMAATIRCRTQPLMSLIGKPI
jgi:hypothetical protein